MRTFATASTVLLCSVLLTACAHGGYGALRPTPQEPDTPASAGNDRATYTGLIRQMQEHGLFYASLAHIDAYRSVYGDTPEITRMHADALRETGQQAAALALYRGLLNTTQAAAAWHGIGLIEALQGHPDEAGHALEEAVRRDPINAGYLGDLGYARLRAGDHRGAREPLAKAAELDPASAKAAANLALLLTVEGDDAGAAQLMQRAGLSAAARNEVSRMAGDIRRSQRDVPEATARTTVSNSPVAQPTPGIAGSMLDRFGANPSTHQGHSP